MLTFETMKFSGFHLQIFTLILRYLKCLQKDRRKNFVNAIPAYKLKNYLAQLVAILLFWHVTAVNVKITRSFLSRFYCEVTPPCLTMKQATRISKMRWNIEVTYTLVCEDTSATYIVRFRNSILRRQRHVYSCQAIFVYRSSCVVAFGINIGQYLLRKCLNSSKYTLRCDTMLGK